MPVSRFVDSQTVFDAVVIGGGVAGASLALRLARARWRVVLIDEGRQEASGVSQYGAADLPVQLARLGITGTQLSAALQPSQGLLACWGDNAEGINWLSQYPAENGWRVDYSVLGPLLQARAKSARAIVLQKTRLTGLERQDKKLWLLHLHSEQNAETPRQIKARFVLDASGRHAAVAGMLGIDRHWADRGTALTLQCKNISACFELDREPLMDVLEAAPEGWWWCTEHAGGRALSLMTDTDLCDREQLQQLSVLLARVPQAPAIAQRLELSETPTELSITSASTGVLRQVCGEGWLTLGDAACVTDGLALNGLEFALASSEHAFNCLQKISTGDFAALAVYDGNVQRIFDSCIARRRAIYAQQTRFSDSAFWMRRQHFVWKARDNSAAVNASGLTEPARTAKMLKLV